MADTTRLTVEELKDSAAELKRSGKPRLLTIGDCTFVIQDVDAYNALVEAFRKQKDLEAIKEGLREADEGKLHDLEELKEEWESVIDEYR